MLVIVRALIVALDVPGVDPESLLADTGVLVDRLFSRAAEYLDARDEAGVEDAVEGQNVDSYHGKNNSINGDFANSLFLARLLSFASPNVGYLLEERNS